MKEVLIIYKFLPRWRVDFFNRLKNELKNNNIELKLVYGKMQDSSKKDEVNLPWAKYKKNTFFKIFNKQLIWQPAIKEVERADLVIVEQANKLLINYYLMISRLFWKKKKFAYWGHGFNRQDNPNSILNRIKMLYIQNCDWWFAYTHGVKQFIIDQRFPDNKITVVQNAIDTDRLKNRYNELNNKNTIKKIRKELGIYSNNVAIYCGSLYKEKRLSFLIETCDKVKKEIPDFELIVLGDGQEVKKIKSASKTRSWIRYYGAKFDLSRVDFFVISSVFLMPGAIGLAILDAFAMETPMITTKYLFHGPEYEYLIHNKNGLISDNSIDEYSNLVIKYFKDLELQQKLIEGCIKSSTKYTIEKMVYNFKEGIKNCLNDNKSSEKN